MEICYCLIIIPDERMRRMKRQVGVAEEVVAKQHNINIGIVFIIILTFMCWATTVHRETLPSVRYVMERRRSLKRKKEEDMSEQEAGLPSVRARIAEFESHSQVTEQDDASKSQNTGKREPMAYRYVALA